MVDSIGIDISIIIVTYNSAKEIFRCLNSILTQTGHTIEIVVIDNHSTDATLAIIQNWQNAKQPALNFNLIVNDKNLGFTRAINEGLGAAKGHFILLLNPDTELLPGTLMKLMAFIKLSTGVGLVAPQLRYPNGQIQPSVRRFPEYQDVFFELIGLSRLLPHHPIFNRWKMGDFNHCCTRDVDQPQGAFFFMPANVVKEIGLFDEQFHMFFSDVDYCFRIKKAGWRIVFYPEIVVYHHQGTSVLANRERMIVSSHRSFCQYFNKYFNKTGQRWYNRFLKLALLTALIPRLVITQI